MLDPQKPALAMETPNSFFGEMVSCCFSGCALILQLKTLTNNRRMEILLKAFQETTK